MPVWETLLQPKEERVMALPWVGGHCVSSHDRLWAIKGSRPKDYGWYSFKVLESRNNVALVGPAEPDLDAAFGNNLTTLTGYLVGDRLIPDSARVVADPTKLLAQTKPILFVEPGLERFSRVTAAYVSIPVLIFIRQEFPQGPETDVTLAYEDRKNSVSHVPGVTPALDLAFRFASFQRTAEKEREQELVRQRERDLREAEAAQQLEEARQNMGTGAGRRALAAFDFKEAARAALALSGAELLDCFQEGRDPNRMIVRYRCFYRRLECIVDRQTLRIIDAGICLSGMDTEYTLETLPLVVSEGLRTGQLVVWRHAPGDQERHGDYDGDHDDEW